MDNNNNISNAEVEMPSQAMPKSKIVDSSKDVEKQVYLPSGLVGGSIPYISGTEDEAVWNAAAHACGTERIYYVYTVYEERCWYLATPSKTLASNPESWCPLASALPGNSEFWDFETVHIYEQDGMAAALRWDSETGRMQVFVGASRTILPRIQSMEGNFVTINKDSLSPIEWKNRALMQEKLSRATVRGLFWSGLIVTLIALSFWLFTHIAATIIKPDVRKAQQETESATIGLMLEAGKALTSESQKHLYRVQELLVNFQDIGGTLIKYEIDKGQVVWEALIPSSLAANTVSELGAKTIGREGDGRLRIQGNR